MFAKALSRLSAALMAIAFLLVSPAAAAQTRYQFDLPEQPLEESLKAVGRITGMNVLFEPRLVKGKTARPVRGVLTADEALSRIVAEVSLEVQRSSDTTVVIREQKVKSEVEQGNQMPAKLQGDVHRADEYIVVTAQKRDERAFDVPMSIVALSGSELQKRKVTNLDELAMVVPGLAAVSNGAQARRIVLRGISNPSGSSSLIGLYLDESSVTLGPAGQLDLRTYDLERVEVLRGPQGTLYGEGSVGGTIRFITRDPKLAKFEMNADMATLWTQSGTPSQRIETALNVPVVEHELGVRVAATFDHQGGWIDQPAANRSDYNDKNLADVRIKGLWLPTSQLSINAMALIHRFNGASNNGEDTSGNFRQAFNVALTPSVRDNYDLFNLTLGYDLPSARLLLTSSYLRQQIDSLNTAAKQPLSATGTPQLDIFVQTSKRNVDAWTDEARLTSIGSGPWQWTVGAFYRDAKTKLDQPLLYTGIAGASAALPTTPPIVTLQDTVSKSWAVFGDTSYRLTERMTLGTGLRHFEEDQEFKRSATAPIESASFKTLNPRFYAKYQMSEGINTYASAAKGFRSGGFNQLNQPVYGPESVWTYELGTKLAVMGGRLSADLAAFYSDYTDYQIFGVLPPPAPVLSIFRNAGSARIKGMEWAIAWQPANQWRLHFNGYYVTSEFYKVDTTSSPYITGDPVDLVPKYTVTASLEREFSWHGRSGFARLDYSQQGKATFRNRPAGPWFYSESDVIKLLNASIALRWSDRLTLGAFAQNLLNDRGAVDPLQITGAGSRPRPRTFGVELGAKF